MPSEIDALKSTLNWLMVLGVCNIIFSVIQLLYCVWIAERLIGRK